MTAPLPTLESPEPLAGQSLGAAHCSAFVCCGASMTATGLGYCNGWRCETCGKTIEDTITITPNAELKNAGPRTPDVR